MKCLFPWANYRVLFHRCAEPDPTNIDPDTGQQLRYPFQCPTPCPIGDGTMYKLRGPGSTECPKCEHIYVEWLNYAAWAWAQLEQDP